jgi:hypothetical protein
VVISPDMVISVFGLGASLALAGKAIRVAPSDQPRARLGARLSVGSLAGTAVATSILAYLAIKDLSGVCYQGPPEQARSWGCFVCGLVMLGSAGGFLLLLSSLVVWPPWRRPFRFQLIRLLHIIVWWSTALSALFRCGD